MGLFDFLKPGKDPLQKLFKQPKMKKAILATDLEFAQKQIANLRAVGQAHKEFDTFLGVWRTVAPPIGLMLCEYGCSVQKVRPTPEFATAFKTHEGRLHSGCDYYILQFPPAPPPAQIAEDKLIELVTKSPEKVPVLAPYFAATIDDHSSGRRAYYVLGQSPGGGSTLRSVTADGTNANLGPGPEPTAASFLQCLRKRHVS